MADAWTDSMQGQRRALLARLAASRAAPPRVQAELHAELAEVLKDLGYNHGYEPGLREARTHARQATMLVPEEPLYWLLRGRREADVRAQIACFTEALRLSGGSPAAYKERGYAFKVLKYYAAAREDFLRSDAAAEGHGNPVEEAELLAVKLASPEADHGLPGQADALAAAWGAGMLVTASSLQRAQRLRVAHIRLWIALALLAYGGLIVLGLRVARIL